MEKKRFTLGYIGKTAFIFAVLLLGLCVIGISVCEVYAQEAEGGKKKAEAQYDVSVQDVNLLVSGKISIYLWGVEKIKQNAAIFDLKARNALENKINDKPVTCMIQAKKSDVVNAQCINHAESDLSLFLLQRGLVSADRAAIYGSVYEKPYLEAESVARKKRRGVWSIDGNYSLVAGDKRSKNFMLGAFLLVAVFIVALIVLGFFVMRGFGRVIDVQSRSLDLAMKERDLREKEKLVIASMINSEVKENKSKIEAYLLVYEEMLQDFSDSAKSPAYQKTGEVIQKQPALSRVVFDGNTDKLDLFGTNLASNLVHYYARIKTNPDYVEIAPDTPIPEVRDVISIVVKNARKLDDISGYLLDKFSDHEALRETSDLVNQV